MVTETLSIKVSRPEKNLLREHARKRRVTASALLRDALREVLRTPQTDGASLLGRHMHLFEGLDSGPGDLSSNKAHLHGFGK